MIGKERKSKLKKEIHGGEEMDVVYLEGMPGLTAEEMIAARERGENVHRFRYCPKPDPSVFEAAPGITCHRDMTMCLRDGVKICFDLYMPAREDAEGTPVPLIVCWTMFGKRMSEGPGPFKILGVPDGAVTKMCKFESADPGYWCHYGYAVANVDPRGVGNSEGDCSMFGENDARDGYDFVEWCAAQSWCTGRISLFGNSGGAMPAWRIAAQQPPHLSCIAPWEGTSDMYRESICVGGIPSGSFDRMIVNGIGCSGWIEDLNENLKLHPHFDAYWQNKAVDFEKILCPTYLTAGWCHFHLRGSLEGFRRLRTAQKWLRIHREFEWRDAYHYENLEDLRRFFDRYLKEIRNGWEYTPVVRMDVMDAYAFDLCGRREETDFPLRRTEYRRLYLDADSRSAEYAPFSAESELQYNADDMHACATFDHVFREDTEISGYMRLRLWVECRGHDDMDLFIWIKKLGQDGQYVPIHCMDQPYRGAWGYLRVSARELDEALSTDFQPVQAHKRTLKLAPGEIVPIDVEIWPHSRFWHSGEALRVEIAPAFVPTEWYEDERMGFVTDNGGKHVIHTGGQYESYLQIPVIPPKYEIRGYAVR